MFDNKPNSEAKGVVPGTDIKPYNTGLRKNFHYLENIYDPDKHPIDDLHRYVVPQENELVFDVIGGIIYRVTHVDWQATLKSTLAIWKLLNDNSNETDEQDWIFGVRGGPGLGEALLSIDYSVRPNTARIDTTIMRPGASYAKLYMGNDVGINGKVISAQYNGVGTMISDRVPVRLAEIIERSNLNIMTTSAFSVTENEQVLSNGTRCTLVFYDEGGEFIPPAQPVMVQHSSYMKDHQIGVKYVTEVELLSPWFTNTINPERLLVPININLTAVELRGVVHYSDGTGKVLPVNGTKFVMHGLQEYRPKFPGQTADVVLTYKLDESEQHYLANPGAPDHKSRKYTFEASVPLGAYSPKLYTYPQWDAGIKGYRLQHFLYDLNRETLIDVSNLVTFNDQSPIYRPDSYSIAQNLIFNINLKDVSPANESVIFVQHTEIVLLRDKNMEGSKFEVNYSYGQPTYRSKFFESYNPSGDISRFSIKNGFDALEEWLEGLYYAVYPSFDRYNEAYPPVPTHYDIMHEDGRRWRFPIATWEMENDINLRFEDGSTVYINWVYREPNGDELQLATTGITVVNS